MVLQYVISAGLAGSTTIPDGLVIFLINSSASISSITHFTLPELFTLKDNILTPIFNILSANVLYATYLFTNGKSSVESNPFIILNLRHLSFLFANKGRLSYFGLDDFKLSQIASNLIESNFFTVSRNPSNNIIHVSGLIEHNDALFVGLFLFGAPPSNEVLGNIVLQILNNPL